MAVCFPRVTCQRGSRFLSRREHLGTFTRSLLSSQTQATAVNDALQSPENIKEGALSLDFSDTKEIFKTLSTFELVRAMAILSVSSFDYIADNAEKLMSVGQKVLGNNLFHALLKETFFSQFVAGENIGDVDIVRKKLLQAGILTMLLVPTESDDPESVVTDYESCEPKLDQNTRAALDSIKATGKEEFAELKPTSFCSPQLLRLLTEKLAPFQETSQKPEGYTLESFARGLEEDFEGNLVPDLDEGANQHLRRSLRRLDQIAEGTWSNGSRILFAAEHTFQQAAINHFVMTLQFKYNRVRPIIFNTYQAYLKDTEKRLKADLQLLEESGTKFAAKIVRGAYMEHERARAARHGYEDPIKPSAEETHKSYDSCVQHVFDSVHRGQAHLMLATHNHTSVTKAVKRMKELQITPSSGSVTFAQTYGMSDHLSFTLGAAGFITYKAVPYGTVENTLLFLARRARENKTAIVRSRKDRPVLRSELVRRLMASASFRQ